VLTALGGEIVAAGPQGRRTIAVAEFVTGPFENALLPGEIAVEARIPPPQGVRRGTYLKLERRVGDFATAGVAIALEMSGDTVRRAGIALTGVGSATIAATDAAAVLVGSTLDPDVIARAADLAAEVARPQSDHRGSADYKRHVVRTFVQRGLNPAEELAA
jgi:carbon-monoxide dehydrogenase medium subunit